MWLNKVTLCFCFGGSCQSLKVRKVKCIPGDPAITCPVLFKGSRSPLSLALLCIAYCTLRPYLVRRYLVFCWLCCVMLAGTALYICLLVYAGLSLFIIGGLLCVYGCMRSLRVQPYMGWPEKWQKQGRAKWVLSRFCHVIKKGHGHFRIAPLSFNCFRRFSLNSTLFIHSPCQTGSQPMSGQLYKLHFDIFIKYVYNI